ncbi:hypothetical protein GQ600_19479 [Phytophthora cactorum]|nr:hypothetical protein GQ600_19479 [Phytophthora cactorum]
MEIPVPNEVAASSKWIAQQKAGRKGTIPPPTSDDYTHYTMDQLMLELRRLKHCPYRLLSVLFSEEFFDRFITSGDTLTLAELDDGGRVFWDNLD